MASETTNILTIRYCDNNWELTQYIEISNGANISYASHTMGKLQHKMNKAKRNEAKNQKKMKKESSRNRKNNRNNDDKKKTVIA